MAYMNQEKKKQLAPKIKAVLKKYGLKGSLSVRNHTALVLKITSGVVNFESIFDGRGYASIALVGKYLDHGQVKPLLLELWDAMNNCEGLANYDNSDSQTDYFDVGWYCTIEIGDYDKPYKQLIAAKAA